MSTGLLSSEHPVWKKAFWIISLFLLILMPVLSRDFGQNGDEDVESMYGKDIWNFYLKGDRQAVRYDHTSTHLQGLEFYGGQFDVITEGMHKLFPSWHIIDVRHFFAALFGALLIMFTGLLAYRLSGKKWLVAVIAQLFLLFSPRIFGESMNNGKDIPFAMGMVMGVYYLVRLLQDQKKGALMWKETLLLALSWAIVLGMRSAGGLLFVAYVGLFVFLYYLFNKIERKELTQNKSFLLKRLFIYLLVAFVVGYVLGLLTWPFGLQAPIGNLLVTLKELANRTVNIRVLFDGAYYSSTAMPWYYEFKWIFISNPVIVLLCAVIFILLIPKAIKQYSLFVVSLLIFAALFPLVYIVYKNSTVYDTWRHVFFVYPFWVIIAALSVDMVQGFLKDRLKWVPLLIVALGLLPPAVWTVRSHPNQYVYFNEFVGGPAGAFGYYDLDYYLVSGKQSAQWILKHAKRPPQGQKIRVLTNMEGMDTYFRNDTSWIYTTYARYYERNQKDWDYYITYGRFVSEWQLQNGKWPPANVVYAVEAGGVPIGVVLERKSKDSYLGYEALQQKDFPLAIEKYASFLKTDSSDEMVYMNYAIALASVGRMDEAIDALKKATLLDGARPDFYQVMAQIYQAKGDQQSAQNAMMTAQSMMAQQQLQTNQ